MFDNKKFICPYCYEIHGKKDCVYSCSYNIPGTNKTCKYGYEKNQDGTIPLKRIGKCSKCDNAVLSRFCPQKNQNGRMLEIPERACGNTFSVALIGAKQSGKSNYIAVLINEIKKRMARSMDCSLIFCNQSTNDMYQDTYYKPLYENATTVKGTDSGDTAPLIYSLDFFDAKSKIRDSVTLSLYDTAGENLDDENTMLCNNQYISNAKGIIILLDPLQLPFVRKKLEGKVDLPDQNSDTNDILTRVIEIIRKRKKIHGSIDIPIAMVFTKIDVLIRYGVLPQGSSLVAPSDHIAKGAFDQADFETTTQEFEGLLENFDATELIQLVKTFPKHAFFGISALGENPKDGVQLTAEPNPFRVLDPLLWLLSLNKYIKTV